MMLDQVFTEPKKFFQVYKIFFFFANPVKYSILNGLRDFENQKKFF